VVRIASGVGMKKRLEMQAKAAEAGLRVLNPKGGA
jgi:ribosomal protein L32E